MKVPAGNGAVAFYGSRTPTNVYVAFSGSNYQVEVFEADRRGLIKTISLEVGTNSIDPATGRPTYIPFVITAAEREFRPIPPPDQGLETPPAPDRDELQSA